MLKRRPLGGGPYTHAKANRPALHENDRVVAVFSGWRGREPDHVPGLDLLKGGFGNLIALPLQWIPRQNGNSVFVDDALRPYPDQWQLLASVRRIQDDQVEWIVNDASRRGQVVGVRIALTDPDAGDEPWTMLPSKRAEMPVQGPFPECVELVRSNLIYIPKTGLPEPMVNRLIRLAAFQNPEFYKAQSMRLSTWDKPRIIFCGEDLPHHVAVPRGCLQEVRSLLDQHGIRLTLRDERTVGCPIEVTFQGELHPEQSDAVEKVLRHDEGIICAPTAFGKTVVGAALIAERKVNTLVLVHRQQLLDQWRERLAAFLDLPIKSIGQIGGGKSARTGVIDVAVIQSLQRKGEVKDFVAEYGQVIVDECHHISAFTFEQVMKQGILVWKEAVIRIEAQMVPALHGLSQDGASHRSGAHSRDGPPKEYPNVATVA